MRNLLIATAAIVSLSGAAFAQGANQGGGTVGPAAIGTSGTANTTPAGNMPGATGNTISSNGTGTTSTGGIGAGVGSTLSTTGTGGQLGNQGGNAGGTGGGASGATTK